MQRKFDGQKGSAGIVAYGQNCWVNIFSSRAGPKTQLVYKSTNVRLNNMCNVCRCCLSTTKMCTVQTISMIRRYLQKQTMVTFLYTICIPPLMLAYWRYKIITNFQWGTVWYSNTTAMLKYAHLLLLIHVDIYHYKATRSSVTVVCLLDLKQSSHQLLHHWLRLLRSLCTQLWARLGLHQCRLDFVSPHLWLHF